MDEKAMEAEKLYITGEMTLKALGEQTGISLVTLKKWSAAGGWAQKRQQFRKRAMKKAVTRAVNRRAKELCTLLEASGALERALLKAAMQFEGVIGEGETDTKLVDGKNRMKNLLSVAEGIERMAHARTMMGAGMTQADAEKIALLKRRQKLEEEQAKNGKGREGVSIVLLPETEALLEETEEGGNADAGNAMPE